MANSASERKKNIKKSLREYSRERSSGLDDESALKRERVGQTTLLSDIRRIGPTPPKCWTEKETYQQSRNE